MLEYSFEPAADANTVTVTVLENSTSIVVDNSLTDEVKESIIVKFEDLVKSNGGIVEKTDRWGMKKLQYPINYKSEGYYVLMSFDPYIHNII